MQFFVKMRDGASFTVEASYIEVVSAPASTYTFLGPVPGYPVAIIAAFPVELVAAVLPLEQARRNEAVGAGRGDKKAGPGVPPKGEPRPVRGEDGEPAGGAPNGDPASSRPPRPPLPPIAAADV